jgi:diguanylate cyclase (GGDEF)-like protein
LEMDRENRMKSFTLPARLYMAIISGAGIAVLLLNIGNLEIQDPRLLVVLCLLASLALILKVEGPTSQSSYTFSFVVYGFTFTSLGLSAALLVILVSHLLEWLWNTPSWSTQLSHLGTELFAAEAAGLVALRIVQSGFFASGGEIAGILFGMAVFSGSIHLMNGALHWLEHPQPLRKTRDVDAFPFILDVCMLYFGASLSIVWKANPLALMLLVIPTYMLYSALRIPALERKTELDSKTGLFNHDYFRKQLDNELSRSNRFSRPMSVIIADLDLLRNINNTYGHLAGDAVLIGVARAMKQSVREYDVVSRFGGEEFAILLPETTLVQAYEKAEFFRKTIEAMEFDIPTSAAPIRATMSFGVAQRENKRQSSNQIIHNADLALYNSKLRGRNRTFAHTHNVYLDFPAGPENGGGSAGMDLNSHSALVWENFLLPPGE